MATSRLFMPLLTELGDWETDFCFKHVAPNGAPAFQRELFNNARWLSEFSSGAPARFAETKAPVSQRDAASANRPTRYLRASP